MSTSRLETFCDGVFAIAITLLVLIFSPPHSGSLSHGLVHQWPSFLAYVVSFATIGIMWVNHHEVMRHIAHTDRTFLYVNVFFVMTVAFLPYPTRIVAMHIRGSDERSAALSSTVSR